MIAAHRPQAIPSDDAKAPDAHHHGVRGNCGRGLRIDGHSTRECSRDDDRWGDSARPRKGTVHRSRRRNMSRVARAAEPARSSCPNAHGRHGWVEEHAPGASTAIGHVRARCRVKASGPPPPPHGCTGYWQTGHRVRARGRGGEQLRGHTHRTLARKTEIRVGSARRDNGIRPHVGRETRLEDLRCLHIRVVLAS
jgi:hypothetical protein